MVAVANCCRSGSSVQVTANRYHPLHASILIQQPQYPSLMIYLQPLFAADVPSSAHLHGDPTASRSLSDDSAGCQPLSDDVAALRRCEGCHTIESQEDIVTCGDSTIGCGDNDHTCFLEPGSTHLCMRSMRETTWLCRHCI